jgi:hypothetical protein
MTSLPSARSPFLSVFKPPAASKISAAEFLVGGKTHHFAVHDSRKFAIEMFNTSANT